MFGGLDNNAETNTGAIFGGWSNLDAEPYSVIVGGNHNATIAANAAEVGRDANTVANGSAIAESQFGGTHETLQAANDAVAVGSDMMFSP